MTMTTDYRIQSIEFLFFSFLFGKFGKHFERLACLHRHATCIRSRHMYAVFLNILLDFFRRLWTVWTIWKFTCTHLGTEAFYLQQPTPRMRSGRGERQVYKLSWMWRRPRQRGGSDKHLMPRYENEGGDRCDRIAVSYFLPIHK